MPRIRFRKYAFHGVRIGLIGGGFLFAIQSLNLV